MPVPAKPRMSTEAAIRRDGIWAVATTGSCAFPDKRVMSSSTCRRELRNWVKPSCCTCRKPTG